MLAAVAALAVAAAVGAYFASQVGDGTTVAHEVEQGGPTATPTAPAVVKPSVTPLPPSPTPPPPTSLLTTTATPEPTPPLTTTATPEPTPTPQLGVCPAPVRTTPADFAEPPPVRPAWELPGQRFQGGTSYSEAYVTVHLPAGREFVILSAWSQDESNLVISIYDVQSGSQLIIRGDGCEISRFVRDPAADAVFDEMTRTLEIGSTYVCPVPLRRGPEEAGRGIPESEMTGQRVEGGAPFSVGRLTLHLPPGRQFIVAPFVVKPSGPTARPFLFIYDVQTGSVLHVTPDGCELERFVQDLAVDPIFDQIVATLEVGTHPTPTPPLTATATPTPPPATPEPTPEPGGDGSGAKPPHVEPPPSAMLVTASGEQSAGVYDYCWEGLCVDMLGVIVPADAVIAGAGEPVTFKLAVEPTQLELLAWALDSGKVIKDYEGFFAWRAQGEPSFKYQLPAQSSFQFTPDFPPGRYVIVLGVRASPGDVGYGFLLELAP